MAEHGMRIRNRDPVEVRLGDLAPSDRIRVWFRAPVTESGRGWETAEGEVFRILDIVYVASREHPREDGMSLPVMLEIEPCNIARIERLATASALAAERARAARGKIVYPDRATDAREIEARLTDLAEAIAALGRAGHRDALGRREQLRLQFHDIADQVALAAAKREYLLARARVGGGDFNPATWPDDRVLRIGTVRPLPLDFEPDPRRRRSRAARRAQAEQIFGAVEIETRELAGFLRRAGLQVQRPHPNGYRLEVKVPVGMSGRVEVFGRIEIAPSQNGLWEVSVPRGDNKGQARRQGRLRRSGAIQMLTELVEEWQTTRSGS